MEHSSQGTDGPLLPQHNPDAARRPLSGEPSDPPSREGLSRDGHREEVDIADTAAHVDEKQGPPSASPPASRPNISRPASAEDEQQAIDWIVPVRNGVPVERRRTVGERLESTLVVAREEQLKYATRAKWAGMAINAAMFAQIVSNALITGLSAASTNRQAQIGVSALGALNTVISSFLVRVRGTREPERSITHSQNLEKFIRELEAFTLDEGYSRDHKWDDKIKRLRLEFDKLQTAVHQSENGQPMS